MPIEYPSTYWLPPLLHRYSAPSGPNASPFGPPPQRENTLLFPSGSTFDNWLLRISVRMTDPSGHTTGPSGKPKPVARIVTSLMWCFPLVAVEAVSPECEPRQATQPGRDRMKAVRFCHHGKPDVLTVE